MNETELTAEERATIEKFIRCLQLFRDFDPHIRIGVVQSFLTVALHGNLTVGEGARRTGRPMQSVSTYLRKLGEEQDKNGRPAMGLLAAHVSPFDGRETLVRLTPKGTALTEQIRAVVFG